MASDVRIKGWYEKGVEMNARWLVIVWHSDLSYSQIYLDDTMPMIINISSNQYIEFIIDLTLPLTLTDKCLDTFPF